MVDRWLEVFGNSHFEAWIAGPIMGLALGIAFARLGKPPPSDSPRDERSPKQLDEQIANKQDRVRDREVHHHHHHQVTGSSGDDGFAAAFFAFAFAFAVTLFLFAAYLPHIAQALFFAIAGVSLFSAAAVVTALAGGRFDTMEWWTHAVAPLALSVIGFWIATLAEAAVSPDVVRYAQGLLPNEGKMSLSLIVTGAVKFLKAIRADYVQWTMFDMLAFIALLVSTALSAGQCVHYIALVNFRDGGGRGWRRLALLTRRLGGTGSVVFAGLMLLAAWFLASGVVYGLLH